MTVPRNRPPNARRGKSAQEAATSATVTTEPVVDPVIVELALVAAQVEVGADDEAVTQSDVAAEGAVNAELVVAPPRYEEIDVAAITRNPYQPRRTFDDEAMADLEASVRVDGILQPVALREHPEQPGEYQLIDGERRWRAAQQAGVLRIPAVIRPASDDNMRWLAAAANMNRVDLNEIDAADVTLTLIAVTLGIPRNDVPKRLAALIRNPDVAQVGMLGALFAQLHQGTWQSFAKNKLRMLKWPLDLLEVMRNQGLPYSQAKLIAKVKDEGQRRALLDRWVESRATYAEVHAWLTEAKQAARAAQGQLPVTGVERSLQVVKRLSKASVMQLSEERQQQLADLMAAVDRLLDEQAQEKPEEEVNAAADTDRQEGEEVVEGGLIDEAAAPVDAAEPEAPADGE